MATASILKGTYTLVDGIWEGPEQSLADLLNGAWWVAQELADGEYTPTPVNAALDQLERILPLKVEDRPEEKSSGGCLPVGGTLLPVEKHGSHDQKTHGRRGGVYGKPWEGEGYREFTDEEGSAWHDQHKEWAEGLPEDAVYAVSDYASFGYTDVNAVLRGHTINHIEYEELTPEQLDQYKAFAFQKPGGRPPIEWLPPGTMLAPGGLWPKISRSAPDTERMAKAKSDGEKLKAVIDKHGVRTTENIEVVRGVWRPGASTEDMRASVGRTVRDPAFVSTSLGDNGYKRADGYAAYARMEHVYKTSERATGGSPKTEDYLDSKGVALRTRIIIPSGTKVMPVEAVRRYGGKRPRGQSSESEVLLPPDSKFRVRAFRENVGSDTATLTGGRTLTTPIHEVVLELVP